MLHTALHDQAVHIQHSLTACTCMSLDRHQVTYHHLLGTPNTITAGPPKHMVCTSRAPCNGQERMVGPGSQRARTTPPCMQSRPGALATATPHLKARTSPVMNMQSPKCGVNVQGRTRYAHILYAYIPWRHDMAGSTRACSRLVPLQYV